MNAKSSKFASTLMSALLVTQGFLCVAGVSLVVLRERAHSNPTFVMGTASLDATRVN